MYDRVRVHCVGRRRFGRRGDELVSFLIRERDSADELAHDSWTDEFLDDVDEIALR